MGPAPITIAELIERYDALLIDAFGVLNDSEGALPGAVALLDHLVDRGKPYFIVTNDASRLPETSARRFRSFGLAATAEQFVTSGGLLRRHFAEAGLVGARCFVLGTADSITYVEQAGGEVVPARSDVECDALVVCDDAGYPFLATVEAALSVLYRRLDRGDPIQLVLPNPDLVYPKTATTFGFTSGAAALLLEAALARRYPRRGLAFTRLGKPYPPLFAEARRRAASDSLVMIGDQVETDIAGARGAAIDAALLETGVTRWHEARIEPELEPTYLLANLAM